MAGGFVLTHCERLGTERATPWGNAVPLGLTGYCLACLLFGLTNLGFVESKNIAFLSIACIAIAIVLFTGGLITLRNGNTLDGCMLAAFGMLFVFGPALETWAAAVGLIELPLVVLGAWNLLLAAFMTIWGIPLSRAPIFAFAISPIMIVALTLMGLSMILESSTLSTIAGWVFLIPGLGWGLYAMAVNLSAVMGIELPVGSPLIKETEK